MDDSYFGVKEANKPTHKKLNAGCGTIDKMLQRTTVLLKKGEA